MKTFLSVIALGACLSFGAAQAQPAAPMTAPSAAPQSSAPAQFQNAPDRAPTAQQNKMTACNKDAAGKKGDERKAFMKQCLSAAGTPVAAKATQQDKMKTCNTGATDKKLKGDDRKTYMKACLSTPAA
jgi:hypothetical protein